MNTDEFRNLIDAARARASDDLPFARSLADLLARRPVPDVLEFRVLFDAARCALDRWDVWAAAYLIGGGCSDDSFIDFRAGVVAQGRTWYDRVVAAPDTLAGHPDVIAAAETQDDGVLFDEDTTYAAGYAYELLTGDPDGFYTALHDHETTRPAPRPTEPDPGEDVDFDDDEEMRRRLPRLAALYRPLAEDGGQLLGKTVDWSGSRS